MTGTRIAIWLPVKSVDMPHLRIGLRGAPVPDDGSWFDGVQVRLGQEWRAVRARLRRPALSVSSGDAGSDHVEGYSVEFALPDRNRVVDWSLVRYWQLRWVPDAFRDAAALSVELRAIVAQPFDEHALPSPWIFDSELWATQEALQWLATSFFADGVREYCCVRVSAPLAARIESNLDRLAKNPNPAVNCPTDYMLLEGAVIFAFSCDLPKRSLDEAYQSGDLDNKALFDALIQIAAALDHLDSVGVSHGHVDTRLIRWLDGKVELTHPGLPASLNIVQRRTDLCAPELVDGAGTSGASDQFELALAYVQLRCRRSPQTFQELTGWPDGQQDEYALTAGERMVLARALDSQPKSRWPSNLAFVRALARAVGLLSPREDIGGEPTPPSKNTLTLDAYRALFAATTRPTPDQIASFVEYVARKHSWYKHLPLTPPGVRFTVFLDTGAGFQRSIAADGLPRYRELTDEDTLFHHAMMPTATWRECFGLLNVVDIGAPSFELHSADGTSYFGSPLGVLLDGEWFAIPSEIAFAGGVMVTGCLHDYGAATFVWERYLEEMSRIRGELRWPEVSGGLKTLEAIRLLVTSDSHTDTDRDIALNLLVAPERLRQRSLMKVQIERLITLVYDNER